MHVNPKADFVGIPAKGSESMRDNGETPGFSASLRPSASLREPTKPGQATGRAG
jgi:hypothetical protein